MPDVKRSIPAHKTKPGDLPKDIDSWLDRNEVSDLLGIALNTIKNLENRDHLHPLRVLRRTENGSERLAYVYDPREVAKVPRKDRYVAIRSPGETAARAFELFDLGKNVREIVIEMREMPETILALKEQWLDHGGADRVISPGAWERLEEILGPFASVTDLVEIVGKLAAACARIPPPPADT